MNDTQLTLGKSSFSMRWMTRLLSALVSTMFLLIIFLSAANEDKPQGMAIPVLALLVLTIMGCLAAWRWEKVGGIVVIISALCLSIAAYSASLAFGLASLSFLPALIYGAPFLILGILFLVCAKE